MTQEPIEPEITEEEKETMEETSKIPPIAKTPPKFGPAAFQSGSKFGKGAMNANPPMKQRPGRAAGRGR